MIRLYFIFMLLLLSCVAIAQNKAPDGSISINRVSKYADLSPEELIKQVFIKNGEVKNVKVKVGGWKSTGTNLSGRYGSWTSTVDNVARNQGRGFGYFDRGTIEKYPDADAIFPLKEGLILSSGNIRQVEGPNADRPQTHSGIGYLEGLDDLLLNDRAHGVQPAGTRNKLFWEQLLKSDASNTYPEIIDETYITFEFTATTKAVEFKYIFASDEYPEFVNTSYNDAFGFFIVKKGANLKTAKNIALVPNSTEPISINTVNFGGVVRTMELAKPDPWYYFLRYNAFCSNVPSASEGLSPAKNYQHFQRIPIIELGASRPIEPGTLDYRNHSCFTSLNHNAPQRVKMEKLYKSTELNGRTNLMVATAILEPCETYELTLLLGNIDDNQLSSSVFLAANSFDLGGELQSEVKLEGGTMGKSSSIYKGAEGNIIFDLGYENDFPKTDRDAKYTSTHLVNGTDYYTPNTKTPLPTKFTFPAGQIYKQAFAISEASQVIDKSFIVEFNGICNFTEGGSLKHVIKVLDPSKVNIDLEAPLICTEDNAGQIRVKVNNGLGYYQYRLLKVESNGNENVVSNWTQTPTSPSDTYLFTNVAEGNYIVEVKDLAYINMQNGDVTNIRRATIEVVKIVGTIHNKEPMEDCGGVFVLAGINGILGTWTAGPSVTLAPDPANSNGRIATLDYTTTKTSYVDWKITSTNCSTASYTIRFNLSAGGNADLATYKNIYKTVKRADLTASLDLNGDLPSNIQLGSIWQTAMTLVDGITISNDGKIANPATILKQNGTYVFEFRTNKIPCAGNVIRYYYLTIEN